MAENEFLNINFRADPEFFPSYISNQAMTSERFAEVNGGIRFKTPHLLVNFQGFRLGYWHLKDFLFVREELLHYHLNNDDFYSFLEKSKALYKKARQDLRDFLDTQEEKSAEDIYRAYVHFSNTYREACLYAYPANLMDKVSADRINKRLEEIFPNKEKGEVLEIMLTLTRNPNANFIYNHDLELIKILLSKGLTTEHELETVLDAHIEDWKYLFRGSVTRSNEALGSQVARDRVSEFKKLSVEELLAKEEEIRIKYSETEKEIKEVEEKFAIPEDVRKIIRLSRESVVLKETRKFAMIQLVVLMDEVFKLAYTIVGIEPQNLSFLPPADLEDILVKGENRFSNDSIKNDSSCALYVIKDGEVVEYVSDEAKEHMAKYGILDEVTKLTAGLPSTSVGKEEKLENVEKQRTYKGFVSSRGYYEGPARVVLSFDDFKKVTDGDILVTPLTTPEYVSIFSKIRAMVTFDGAGLTSHPATLSREYKIPAILGIKELKGIIKDGDILIVDANNGHVIIK